MKYLEVKNWGKYQASMKHRDWIRDYVNQNDDEDLGVLSLFERGLLQELRRLRGRTGRNIYNDVTHIALAIHAKGTDRPHIRHALDTLIARKFLIPTNQAVDSLEERREEEKREEREEIAKELPPIALAQKVITETSLPGNPNMMHAVAGAIEFLVKVDHKSPNAAVEFLIAHVLDETAKGKPPNRFWFDDRKWMVAFLPPKESQTEQMLKRVFNEAD